MAGGSSNGSVSQILSKYDCDVLMYSQESEDITQIYTVLKEFSEGAAPGAFIADLIPPLAKIPEHFQWWRASALAYQHRQTRIWMKFWNNLREQMAAKRAPECFVKQFIETQFEKQGIDEVQAAYVAGSKPALALPHCLKKSKR